MVCPCNGCCFKLHWFVRKHRYPTGPPTAVGVVRTEDGSITLSVDGCGWTLPVSTICTVLNSSADKGVVVSLHLDSLPEAVGEASLLDLVMFQAIRSIHRRLSKKEQMTSYAAVDLMDSAQRTEEGTAHTAEASATRRVVERGRSRGWSFRFGTSHQSCACTHRRRVWFLFCLSSQPVRDFILRRHQCLCFSRGMVPVPMVGLRASQFGTASELPPGELPTHRHLLTHTSRAVPKQHPRVRAATFGMFLSRTEPRFMKQEVHRALVVRAMRVGCSVTAVLIGMTLISSCSV